MSKHIRNIRRWRRIRRASGSPSGAGSSTVLARPQRGPVGRVLTASGRIELAISVAVRLLHDAARVGLRLARAVPMPGGVGALDAGLTGALVLYGISPAHAAAAVLVYHAIALSVPGVGGLYAYLRLRPQLRHSPSVPRSTGAFDTSNPRIDEAAA